MGEEGAGGSLPFKALLLFSYGRKEHFALVERQGGGKPGAVSFVPANAKRELIDKLGCFGKQKEVYKAAREPTV